eukprot:Blabericola_migrator_1__6310@NODE_3186_length_1966_cov_31_786730_g1993_i0_p1_GENE_NODE_3186_length_1966_cov_31_786730_g1993_i0NODE_3186_length_1966_cov_31_786730_g1993_i0_p1_ORF_typecomplete_len287_score47_11zfCCHC_4/PF14392_6/0_086zfCCHC_4/PF14392_6/0_27zfCCHC_4/PF14392_6/3_5zfCCHC_4/PF14392_6/0_037zfCCHC_4/PF14392_6/0_025zfCCHC_4/PF14392_6/0_29zfCCHC/PF00098_23/0_14zfCCHC/PF00098_23/0_0038zfCCHC/PF00098_23/5_6zfCCHC/PF00098_23/1_1zfCCHC/PF00098_23/0_0053zfCCHC/PF00098_23/3_6zfCCHC_2/PF13696_6/
MNSGWAVARFRDRLAAIDKALEQGDDDNKAAKLARERGKIEKILEAAQNKGLTDGDVVGDLKKKRSRKDFEPPQSTEQRKKRQEKKRNDIKSERRGICFKCGDDSHALKDCPTLVSAEDDLPFAECFGCGEKGHLASRCPNKRQERTGEKLSDDDEQPRRECLNCRSTDHLLKSCPLTPSKSRGICFRCGEDSHSLKSCPTPAMPDDALPFAECFTCGAQGHLASRCPNNPRGVYPKGGSCFRCQSIYHLSKNCPMRTEKIQEKRQNRIAKRRRKSAEKKQSSPAA